LLDADRFELHWCKYGGHYHQRIASNYCGYGLAFAGREIVDKKYAEFSKDRLISVLDGLHYMWYENGKPKEEGAHKDNLQSGKWIYYYDDGKKQYEQTFIKGKQEGKVTSWYAIGTLESEKYFKNGRPDGKWTFYAKRAGEVKQEIYFKDGIKVQK